MTTTDDNNSSIESDISMLVELLDAIAWSLAGIERHLGVIAKHTTPGYDPESGSPP